MYGLMIPAAGGGGTEFVLYVWFRLSVRSVSETLASRTRAGVGVPLPHEISKVATAAPAAHSRNLKADGIFSAVQLCWWRCVRPARCGAQQNGSYPRQSGVAAGAVSYGRKRAISLATTGARRKIVTT